MQNKRISLSEPFFFKDDYKLLKKCIDSTWVSTSGKNIDLFEKKISKFTGSKYAIATINGTSSLHISLMLSGVSNNHEVIVPCLTFIASINAIKYNLAEPIFMDVDDYCNIDENKTLEFIKNHTYFKEGKTYNKKTNKIISALLIVHVWGNAASFSKLKNLCKKINIKIIEDASESLGTFYKQGVFKGKHTGTNGLLGCISFNGNKIMTTGGGGIILTDNKILAQKARYFISQAKDDTLNFTHNNIGYNYKLTNLNATLGLVQLKKIKLFIKKRSLIYSIYKKKINKIKGLNIISVPDYAQNNHWLSILRIDLRKYDKTLNQLQKIFLSKNIQTRPIWKLNHLQLPFKKNQTYKIENAQKLVKTCLCLPSSFNLTFKDQIKIIKLMDNKNV